MNTLDAPRLADVAQSRVDHLTSLDFMKYLACFAIYHGNAEQACAEYLDTWPTSFSTTAIRREQKALELHTKAATNPGTTGVVAWAGALTGVEQLASGFLALARSASLLGRVPGLRMIPFNVKIPTQSQGASYAWVSEQGSKPVSQMVFEIGVTLSRLKAAGINVYTSELIRSISDATETALRDSLIDGLTSFTDSAFLSTAAAVTTVSPAGILNGVTPVTPGANFAASIDALLDAFFAARPAAQAVSFIAAPRRAAQLRVLNGGAGPGYPIIETAAAGSAVILVDASAIFVADGGVEVSYSGHAAIQFDSAPVSPPTATVVVRSLWQDNLMGLRVERFLNWFAAPTSVAFLA